MKFIVRIPELDSALYADGGEASHRELFQIIRKLKLSGRLVEGGLLADDRGGVLLMEADSCSEHAALLNDLFDRSRFTVESHPLLPFRNLTSLVDKIGPLDKPPAVPRSVVISKTTSGKITRRLLLY